MLPVAVLCRAGSNLGEQVLRSLPCEGVLIDSECAAGEPLTVDGDGARWGGVHLARVSALLVESPLYPWPQPLAAPRADESREEFAMRASGEREARALSISALRVAARATRVCNNPVLAGELAASPALALDRLEAAHVPVLPWRVTGGGAEDTEWRRFAACGGAGATSDVEAGPVLEVRWGADVRPLLVIGGAVVAVGTAGGGAPGADERALAVRATTELGLDFATVHLSEGAVGRVEAAPDLDHWNQQFQGLVASALAELLLRTD